MKNNNHHLIPDKNVRVETTLPAVPDSALYPLHADPDGAPTPHGEQPPAQPLLALKTFLREQEQAHLNLALQQCGGDKEQAALLLGVSLATLYRKLSGEDKEA